MLARRTNPDEARARLLVLKEATRRRALALRDRLERRRADLEKALEEYTGALEHLHRLKEEGRYPEGILRPALEREELRIRHARKALERLEEEYRTRLARLLAKARHRAARLAALAQVDLDALFQDLDPTPRKEGEYVEPVEPVE